MRTDLHLDPENQAVVLRRIGDTGAPVATSPQVRMELEALQYAHRLNSTSAIEAIFRRLHFTKPIGGGKKRCYGLFTVPEADATDDDHSDATEDLYIGGTFVGTTLQLWAFINVDTTAHTSGTANFYSRSVAGLIDTILARDWASEFTGPGPEFSPYWPFAALRYIANPSSETSPFGDLWNSDQGAPTNEGLETTQTDAIWGNDSTPGSPLIFRGFHGGFFLPVYGGCSYWLSLPMLVDVNTWENPILAQRQRYRTDGLYTGWEASAELWIEHANLSTGLWVDGWSAMPGYQLGTGVYHRLKPKNFIYRQAITTTPFDGAGNPSDLTSGWTEIQLPAHTDAFYTPASTLMDGFCGRCLFHAFEDPAAWQSRTGWTLSGAP